MDNSDHHYSNTLNHSGFPERVLVLCDGLFRINSDFFESHLQKLLSDFESILFRNTEAALQNESQSEQFSHLRNLKRTRHDFIPRFLAGIEHQLANIRKTPGLHDVTVRDMSEHHRELQLLEIDVIDYAQLQLEISTRCESQHSFELFLLGQRFGVLAGQPALDFSQIPIGPQKLCLCLQEAIECLNLDATNTRQIYFLFERYVFNNFSDLIQACNIYLINNEVLSNISYVPFRNPELRHKKTPIALHGKTDKSHTQVNAEQKNNDTNIIEFKSLQTEAPINDELIHAPEKLEENFSQLRHLLAKRKQLLNKLSSYSTTYLGDANQQSVDTQASSSASPDLLQSILRDFQQSAVNKPNTRASIQHLKHDLMAQLRNQSTNEHEIKLNEEDSDAIDMVGLVMDDALKDVNPNSVASQLISMLQTPLIQVVLKDKSFFSNHVHPARQMLNIIAETGFNWLDETSTDDILHEKISGIVNRTVKDYSGDNQELINAYEETNGLLQSLIKKAEAAERRQIEAVTGKERLTIAHNRASTVMAEITGLHDLPPAMRSILNKAWTDVMALTELRQGSDSGTWSEQRMIAERIIAIHQSETDVLDEDDTKTLKHKIQDALSTVGYHYEEARNIADNLIVDKASDRANTLVKIPEKIRFGENTQSANIPVFELTDEQINLVEQIKAVAIGTWFEIMLTDNPKPVRWKMAWQSQITHNVLFVNQRGQKTSEMLIEALAIELSEGRARIQLLDKRNLFERAFSNVLSSLRNLMPNRLS